MKILLSNFFVLITAIFCYAQATLKVGFEKKEILVKEGSSEKSIIIPIKIQGDWGINTDFKLKLKFSGDAAEIYDYKIINNTSAFSVNKNNPIEIALNIAILPDMKFEDTEEIIIEIQKDGTYDFLEVTNDAILSSKIIIKVSDYNPVGDAILNRINADKDTTDAIGIYSIKDLTNKNVPVYKITYGGTNNSPVQQALPTTNESISSPTIFKVEKIETAFRSGVIAEIKVYASNQNNKFIFTNILKGKWGTKRIPISIRHIIYKNELNDVRLFALKSNSIKDDNIIKVGDIINYNAKLTKNYPLPDGLILLDDENPIQNIKVNTSLNSYISLNIYTDFLSLVGAEKGNGLVQTEASAHMLLNTINAKKNFIFWTNYIEPFLKYSRFDEGFNFISPTIAKSDTTVDRMLLNQRAYLSTGIKVNVFRKINRFYSELEMNAITNFNWDNVRGKPITPIPNQPQEYELRKVNTISYGLEFKTSIPLYTNFGITAGWTSFIQKIWTKTEFSNSGWQLFHSPEFELFYNPINQLQDKIFLRFRSFLTNRDDENKYVQLQVGYKGQFKFKSK